MSNLIKTLAPSRPAAGVGRVVPPIGLNVAAILGSMGLAAWGLSAFGFLLGSTVVGIGPLQPPQLMRRLPHGQPAADDVGEDAAPRAFVSRRKQLR